MATRVWNSRALRVEGNHHDAFGDVPFRVEAHETSESYDRKARPAPEKVESVVVHWRLRVAGRWVMVRSLFVHIVPRALVQT